MKPSRYRWAWLAWLVAFLAIELPAWLAERKGGIATLSRHIGRYFKGWRLYPLVVFMQVLTWHFVAMVLDVRPPWFGAAAIIVTGIPVFLLFVAGVVND